MLMIWVIGSRWRNSQMMISLRKPIACCLFLLLLSSCCFKHGVAASRLLNNRERGGGSQYVNTTTTASSSSISSSSVHDHHGFIHVTAANGSRSGNSSADQDGDDNVFGVDKRKIHTGPNPLHNKR